MAANDERLTILDLGTARTTLLQARLGEGGLTYAGHVSFPSQGLRKGAVTSLPLTAEGIRRAATVLEQRTGAPVERVYCSLTGGQVKGVGSQAGITLTARSREITRADALRALDLARAIALPDDRQILHVVPQEFVLDRQGGIHEPVGMLASRLEARIYAVTVAAAHKDNLVLAVNQAGLEVGELIFAPLAMAEAGLSAEERHAGVAVLDFGAGSTGLLVYSESSLIHAAVIPIGGDHFTNDIGIGLSTPLPEAERIKCDYGATDFGYSADTSAIEVPTLGDQPSRILPHRRLIECIEPRARELVRLIRAELGRVTGAGPGSGLGAGIVVCGGAWRLQGLPEMLSGATGMAVRPAALPPIAGLPGELGEPEYAFSVGACYYAHRLLARQMRPTSWWEKLREKWAAFAD